MSISVSPLELWLDEDNPRFVVLDYRDQHSIRNYLASYEDVCQLAREINDRGGLLPGERIVVFQDNNKYIVVEGNRRTCALQFLLNRELIPDNHKHAIPETNHSIFENCQTIEVDLIHDRNEAIALMAQRHIIKIKEWKPLAKKQFFASRFDSGMSIDSLSSITGIGRNEIQKDIRDYKFFLSAYDRYTAKNPEALIDINKVEIDRFLRLFSAKFEYLDQKHSPKTVLKIHYDDQHNTLTYLEKTLFDPIVLLAFEESIVKGQVGTRHTLIQVDGMKELLEKVFSGNSSCSATNNDGSHPDENEAANGDPSIEDTEEENPDTDEFDDISNTATPDSSTREDDDDATRTGGPAPGGPSPGSFFEHLSWVGKLDPENRDHKGLLFAINELFKLSTELAGTGRQRKKAYKVFPIPTGMMLRTAYEQALILQMKKTLTWGTYMANVPDGRYPTLSSMETFVKTNINHILPTSTMRSAFDKILRTGQRELLNATVHNIGEIQVTSLTLETLASEGMFTLIQEIINYRAD